MSSPPYDDSRLLIRCPECKQRFRVQPELHDRIVECGVCEHRFRIRDDVIVRMKKFYPGDKAHGGVKGFARVPHAPQAPPVSARFGDPHHYQPAPAAAPPAASYEPAPPQRIIAGFAGVLAMVLMALVLIFGSADGGILDGVDLTRRLVLSAFVAFLGFVLLVYANPRTRPTAAGIAVLMSAVLIGLPFIFTQGSDPLDPATAAVVTESENDQEKTLSPEEERMRILQEQIGLRPLEQEIERLRDQESPLKAFGLYLTGLQQSNRIAVRDYMMRVANPDPNSHIFPRFDDSYLFVLTGLEMNLEQLASLAAPLGEVRRILPEINVVEIAVDNSIFIEGNSEKLVQRDDPEFYQLNLRELNNIELRRVERAVVRLAEAEPKAYRADITQRLHELLDESGVTFHGPVARALAVWDEDTDRAAAAATHTAVQLRNRRQTAPPELVALALKRPTPPLVFVLVTQWQENHNAWESQCIALGPIIEEAMIREFQEREGAQRQSAARILARTGGKASLAVLEEAVETANAELRLILQQSIQLITDRLAEG